MVTVTLKLVTKDNRNGLNAYQAFRRLAEKTGSEFRVVYDPVQGQRLVGTGSPGPDTVEHSITEFFEYTDL